MLDDGQSKDAAAHGQNASGDPEGSEQEGSLHAAHEAADGGAALSAVNACAPVDQMQMAHRSLLLVG
ncbi:hypothetical protein, partial [Staphylococcus aureus]